MLEKWGYEIKMKLRKNDKIIKKACATKVKIDNRISRKKKLR